MNLDPDNADGHVVIADLGLCVFLNAASREFESTRSGNRRFLAPEISLGRGRGHNDGHRVFPGDNNAEYGVPLSLVSPSGRPTQQSDLFSFAMLCIQVSTANTRYVILTVVPLPRYIRRTYRFRKAWTRDMQNIPFDTANVHRAHPPCAMRYYGGEFRYVGSRIRASAVTRIPYCKTCVRLLPEAIIDSVGWPRQCVQTPHACSVSISPACMIVLN